MVNGQGLLFTLKDVTYSPESPRKGEPFVVEGKVKLFGLNYFAPLWVQAKVTYPEKWWEEIIPIIGSPTVAEGDMCIGGDFEINFTKGFDREGEFKLRVEVYPGPTFSLDSIVLPPFPPVASEESTFIVAGEVPPEEMGFSNFGISGYGKRGDVMVTPPATLELEVGDVLRIKFGFDHKGLEVTGKIHAAIWQSTFIDPHDEVLNVEEALVVPASADWEPHDKTVEIVITSQIEPGYYGLYGKIMGITGGDIFTDYLSNVIIIAGAPPTGILNVQALALA